MEYPVFINRESGKVHLQHSDGQHTVCGIEVEEQRRSLWWRKVASGTPNCRNCLRNAQGY